MENSSAEAPDPVEAVLPRLTFIHIPKTAGTSITSFLQKMYGELTFGAMTTLDYAEASNDTLEHFRFYKGHAYRRDFRRFPQDTVSFTVFRDPVERAVSLYRYYKGLDPSGISDHFIVEAIDLAKKFGIIEFIYSASPFVVEHIRLGQVRQFLTEDTLSLVGHRQYLSKFIQRQVAFDFANEIDNINYVMTCDFLEISLSEMAFELGLPVNSDGLPRENSSENFDIGDINDVVRAVIDVNPLEFACYKYAQKKERDLLTRGWCRAIRT